MCLGVADLLPAITWTDVSHQLINNQHFIYPAELSRPYHCLLPSVVTALRPGHFSSKICLLPCVSMCFVNSSSAFDSGSFVSSFPPVYPAMLSCLHQLQLKTCFTLSVRSTFPPAPLPLAVDLNLP